MTVDVQKSFLLMICTPLKDSVTGTQSPVKFLVASQRWLYDLEYLCMTYTETLRFQADLDIYVHDYWLTHAQLFDQKVCVNRGKQCGIMIGKDT